MQRVVEHSRELGGAHPRAEEVRTPDVADEHRAEHPVERPGVLRIPRFQRREDGAAVVVHDHDRQGRQQAEKCQHQAQRRERQVQRLAAAVPADGGRPGAADVSVPAFPAFTAFTGNWQQIDGGGDLFPGRNFTTAEAKAGDRAEDLAPRRAGCAA